MPVLPKPPVPTMVPENVEVTPLLTVSVPVVTVTVPEPLSGPMVSFRPFSSRNAPPATVTAELSARTPTHFCAR